MFSPYTSSMSKPALDAALPAISGLFGDIPEDNPPGSGWVRLSNPKMCCGVTLNAAWDIADIAIYKQL